MFKRGRLSLDQAEVALEAFQRIPIQLVEIDLEASLALAYDLDIYAYDAYMLDCAKRHRSPLLTLDEGLRNAATKAEIKVLEVEE